MPTTYPLTMPGKPGFTAFSRSFDWGGRWWRADWALPEMPRHLAEEWIAFMRALNASVEERAVAANVDARRRGGSFARTFR